MLKITEPGDYPFVKLAKATPRVGDWVVAIGNPFGLGGTVTAGIVSAEGRDIGSGPYDQLPAIDAPINKGNSGGPTFNLKGEVVGVNTAIYSPSGGSVGLGFANTASTVDTIVGSLEHGGFVNRGYLGVKIQDVSPDFADGLGLKVAERALVAETQPRNSGRGRRPGVRRCDREAERRRGQGAPDLTRNVGALKPGEKGQFHLPSGRRREHRKPDARLPRRRSPRRPADRLNRRRFETGLRIGSRGQRGKGVEIVNVDPTARAPQGLTTET